jgi:hypothetical protein
MSNISMGILLSANVAAASEMNKRYINLREGPFELTELNGKRGFYLKKNPVLPPIKKVFIFEYSRDAI